MMILKAFLKKLIIYSLALVFSLQPYILPVFAQTPEPFVGNPEAFQKAADKKDFYVSGNSSRITLELKGVDIIDVLKVLSKKSGLNIIAGKNVRGQVTLFLQNVNVMEALRLILETSELAYEEKNGIIKVLTQRDYEAIYGKPFEDKRVTKTIQLQYIDAQTVGNLANELKSNIGKVIVDDRTNSLILVDIPESIKALEEAITNVDKPVIAKIFTLKYSDVEEIETKITEMITPASGSVKADKRSNRIAVIDFPEKIRQIEEMVEAFDVKPKQVLIEAKIVEVTLNDDYAFGIDWDYVMRTTFSGTDGSFTADAKDFGGLSTFATGPLSSGDFTTFTINDSSDTFFAVLSMLEGMGKTNTLSSPRLSVLNNEEATLSVATRQPYVSQTVVQGDTTSTTADNIEFVDVGVILTVKPKITDDNQVVLKVKPQVSSQASSPFTISQFDDSGNVVGTRASVPIVTTQEVETTVIVGTGRTVVIGGLIQDTESKISRKVPLFGDIPLLGKAFKHETIDYTKSELVLFLTPRIVETETLHEREEKKYLNPKGKLLDFNEVGDRDYDYEKSQRHSITPIRSRQDPFWKQKEEAIHSQIESLSAIEKWARKTNSVPPQAYRSMPHPDETRDTSLSPRALYQSVLSSMINAGLSMREELNPYRGSTGKLILNIHSNGVVDTIGFPRKGLLLQRQMREIVTDVISNISPFPEFPAELATSQATFEVQIMV